MFGHKTKSLNIGKINVTNAWNLDRTTSVPKSVVRYGLDKVRSLDLETNMLTDYRVFKHPQ